MARFSDALMDHFQSPRHCRRMEHPDFVGLAGTPGQGPFLTLYLRVEGDRVAEVSFQCNGCGVTIACGSALMECVLGRTRAECERISSEQLTAVLDGIPPDKSHRAGFALAALQQALHQWNAASHSTEGVSATM